MCAGAGRLPGLPKGFVKAFALHEEEIQNILAVDPTTMTNWVQFLNKNKAVILTRYPDSDILDDRKIWLYTPDSSIYLYHIDSDGKVYNCSRDGSGQPKLSRQITASNLLNFLYKPANQRYYYIKVNPVTGEFNKSVLNFKTTVTTAPTQPHLMTIPEMVGAGDPPMPNMPPSPDKASKEAKVSRRLGLVPDAKTGGGGGSDDTTTSVAAVVKAREACGMLRHTRPKTDEFLFCNLTPERQVMVLNYYRKVLHFWRCDNETCTRNWDQNAKAVRENQITIWENQPNGTLTVPNAHK